jgi:hypothetical protein
MAGSGIQGKSKEGIDESELRINVGLLTGDLEIHTIHLTMLLLQLPGAIGTEKKIVTNPDQTKPFARDSLDRRTDTLELSPVAKRTDGCKNIIPNSVSLAVLRPSEIAR